MFFYGETVNNEESISIYSWWASVMILQLLSFSWFTGRARIRCEIIHSEEDRRWFENPAKIKLCPSGGGHPEIDQMRSGHLKDLAVIVLYLVIAPIWLNTNPCHILINILLRLFPIAKILDTLLYMEVIKAPKICRLIARAIIYAILVYMSAAIIMC